jgi:hypothetical protein
MRLRVRSPRQAVESDLAFDFVPQRVVWRFRTRPTLGPETVSPRAAARRAGRDPEQLRQRVARPARDRMLYVGGRRFEHRQHLIGDPVVARFCSLARAPTARAVSNRLKQFTQMGDSRIDKLFEGVNVDIAGGMEQMKHPTTFAGEFGFASQIIGHGSVTPS